ncbi:MAG: HD domain-containing protein [Candidatus Competibacter denitrificans]
MDLMTGELDKVTHSVVWQGVEECLGGDGSGHGVDHVERVYDLSMGFCDQYPSVGREVVALAAMLHDVDDYKLVGREQAQHLRNATEIMKLADIAKDTQIAVRGIVANMGYSKALRGIRPTTLEGMIVSDADMCDAIGANGITRALMYAVSDKGSGIVFDRNTFPLIDLTADQYNSGGTTHNTDSFINHFFEKLLKVRGMMMTEPGQQEATTRDELMIDFLGLYFREQRAPEWSQLLE